MSRLVKQLNVQIELAIDDNEMTYEELEGIVKIALDGISTGLIKTLKDKVHEEFDEFEDYTGENFDDYLLLLRLYLKK